MSAMLVLAVVVPEVPVTVTVAAPMVAVDDAVSVSTDVTVPFAGGVTGLGENAAVTPFGRPVAVSVVAELNPLRLVTVMVLVAFDPCARFSELGEALTVMPGVPAPTAKIRSS